MCTPMKDYSDKVTGAEAATYTSLHTRLGINYHGCFSPLNCSFPLTWYFSRYETLCGVAWRVGRDSKSVYLSLQVEIVLIAMIWTTLHHQWSLIYSKMWFEFSLGQNACLRFIGLELYWHPVGFLENVHLIYGPFSWNHVQTCRSQTD